MISVVTLACEALGDRSYLVHDAEVGVVIDPQCDVDRIIDIVDDLGLTITHVLETHVHNDYVSGGLHLARRLGADYVTHVDEPVEYWRERLGVRGGDQLAAGSMDIDVVATPGHTPHHLSYLVSGAGSSLVFSGGAVLYGSTGRCDLFGETAADYLARAQWRSAHHLAEVAGDDAELFPTHGFGSLCSASPAAGGAEGTLRAEMERNEVFLTDEETFAKAQHGTTGSIPRYYFHMGASNRRLPTGGRRPMSTIDLAGAAEIAAGGGVVIDLRARRDFASGHVQGSINIEWGPSFAPYAGWVIPAGLPIVLVGDQSGVLEQAAHALTHVGVTELDIAFFEGEGDGSYRVASFAELGDELASGRAIQLVDSRERNEWEMGHLAEAHLAPFHSVESIAAVTPEIPIWIHCAKGYRAAIGASVLDRLGREVVLIDDDFDNAARAGLSIVVD